MCNFVNIIPDIMNVKFINWTKQNWTVFITDKKIICAWNFNSLQHFLRQLIIYNIT